METQTQAATAIEAFYATGEVPNGAKQTVPALPEVIFYRFPDGSSIRDNAGDLNEF